MIWNVWNAIIIFGRLIMEEYSDSEIIEMISCRNELGVEMLNKKYNSLIKRISVNILSSESDVQECINDVLLSIWNTIPSTIPNSLPAFIGVITRRRALDLLRKREHYTFPLEDMENQLFSSSFEDATVERQIIVEILNSFIHSLNKKNREIFLSRYFDFESISEISQKIGLSTNAVSIKLLRMRNKLIYKLQKAGVSL